ncbi:GPO family capsid scaffolding protein [Laribacter hongkongensis]|uniref:GPO family capsid scaffolding protein n=1 Tax=Laribacter hongkongensis TaxID=168471 RepID=UPI001EFD0924|nr:GPO family capsid scaffolding protein [Laribacter hongkongensis]MCG9124308.1 GPO family capsid scaffolding protein [Laribacter hongkongensis]
MAGKSKKFRVATEGATTDGRVIERAWIEQMARNYDPKRYGARVNLEHLKGILPDGPFKSYGDVLELTSEPVEDGKLGLFAVIDPTAELVAMTQARQKIYTSIEVNPGFADTGEAYLVGLAVTDSPASLGTEMLQFSAGATDNPLAARKTSPGNLFTAAIPATIELDDDTPGLLEGFSDKIKSMLGKFGKQTDANTAELKAAVEVIADSQKTVLEKLSQITVNPSAEDIAALKAELAKAQADHTALVQQLSTSPATPPRTPTAGGNGQITTDC